MIAALLITSADMYVHTLSLSHTHTHTHTHTHFLRIGNCARL